ncbi:MAG: Asp-tRNA(Asn)/Glu-tRNA(Gln) amidotransferase subunit GatA [Bacteroidia bacterium]
MSKAVPTLASIRKAIISGKETCQNRVRHYVKRIEDHKDLNAFIDLFEEEALESARIIDQKIQDGTAGRLAGTIIGIKDVICYKGHGLSASSKMLEGFSSHFTATALQRLLDEDAIVIGRQGCDEFAMGSTSESSVYGPVRNPHNASKTPGGSSGGSAAAVAAGLCDISLGSDTGGSVRQPASFCGVVGFKPSYGRVSRWGLMAYGSSFDQIGPITHHVEDAALVLEIMAGDDGKDQTASKKPVPSYSEAQSKTLTIGYFEEAMNSEGLDPEIKAQAEAHLDQLRADGHEVKPLSFPLLDYLVPCYYILTTAEASSNLARYDGVHYGHRSSAAQNISEVYTNSRREGFGKEVQKRILLGTFVLSAGYADAYYGKAMKVRNLIREATLALFSNCDLIFSPTAPGPAYDLGVGEKDPIAMYLGDIFTVLANLTGMPAISIPSGYSQNKLPIGMQYMAAPFEEESLLSFTKALKLAPLPTDL